VTPPKWPVTPAEVIAEADFDGDDGIDYDEFLRAMCSGEYVAY
jgi:hypothetical protein